MHRSMRSRAWRLSIVVVLLFTLFGMTISAQDPGPQGLELDVFEVGPPTFEEFDWAAEPPTLTEEQQAQLEYGIEHTHLPGPARDSGKAVEIAGPAPGTESALFGGRSRSGAPLSLVTQWCSKERIWGE